MARTYKDSVETSGTANNMSRVEGIHVNQHDPTSPIQRSQSTRKTDFLFGFLSQNKTKKKKY